MSRVAQRPSEARQRLEAAAEWRVRLRDDPRLEISDAFAQWMSDADNARAFRAVEDGWNAVAALGAAPQILDMRRAALSRARRGGARAWTPARAVAAAAAVVLLAGLAVIGTALYRAQQPTAFATEVGGRRIVSLSDGSRVSLDSDTLIDVSYSKAARAIVLEKGRARFDVAHDVQRPFTVTAGNETVVAVGTSFDVERIGTKVFVTLLQGHVVIKSATGAAAATGSKPLRPLSLEPGEQLVASVSGKPLITQASPQMATAWEAGHLIFKDETLAEAVARVNRYTERPITVDPGIASIRVSGVFNAGDVGSFVSAVTSYFPVQATTNADNEIVLQGRS